MGPLLEARKNMYSMYSYSGPSCPLGGCLAITFYGGDSLAGHPAMTSSSWEESKPSDVPKLQGWEARP